MDDSGKEKADVKVPDGDVGEKIRSMHEEGKDLSKSLVTKSMRTQLTQHQTSSS